MNERYSELFRRLMKVRGVTEEFLNPQYEGGVDSFLLPDMEKAVKRIQKAIQKKEKITIFGDYDVDGVTATAVMHDALLMAGVEEVTCLLPDRFVDGYGLGKRAVKEIIEKKTELLITVDCGGRNADEVEKLNEAGVDVIITDHHEMGEELPKAVAVVNPKRRDKDYPGRELAGVGVVFKIVQAMAEKEMIKKGQEKWLLDLVAIGTVCDSMVLTGENRMLVYYGLKVLGKTRRVGLMELMRVAGVNRLNGETLGFQIGPRLNAAGRMESAHLALDLLLDKGRAATYAKAMELDALNKERRRQQQSAVAEITERGFREDPVVVVSGELHEGIIGIIAGNLMERLARPTIVFTEMEGGLLKGSGRSFGEFNLAEAIGKCADFVVRGGGHAQAAGVTIRAENLEGFTGAINEYYVSLELVRQGRFLEKKEDLALDGLRELNKEFYEEMRLLEPFGEGNLEPTFRLNDMLVLMTRKMGEKHLRITVRDRDGARLNIVGFYVPEEWFRVQEGDKIEAWVNLSENDWRGNKSIEGILRQIKVL